MDLTNYPILNLSGATPSATPKPDQGERTGTQATDRQRNDPFGAGVGLPTQVKGFAPPPAGTFDTYRKIGDYPTVALAMDKAVGPILDALVSWMPKDEDVPTEWVDAVEAALGPLMSDILENGMLAPRYGFSPFEIVWTEKDGLLVPEYLKPLLVDITEFVYDEKGRIVGLRNKQQGGKPVDLDWSHAFAWTHKGEGGNPYGRSRFEVIRKRWSEVEQIIERFAKYLAKVAAVIGQIHYPDGTSKNAVGADWPNAWLAAEIAKDASQGRWLLIPNKFAAFLSGDNGNVSPAVLEKALAAAGKSDWVVSFLDPGGTDFAPGFTAALEYYDKLLVRGLLMPERSILEGKHGTKAEAGQHDEMTAMDATALFRSFLRAFNRGVVDQVLVYNFGEKARGAVYAEAPPLADDSGESQDKVLAALLASPNPVVSGTAARVIDVVALCEDRDIPVVEQEAETTIADAIDEDAAKQEQLQKQQAEAAQQQAAAATAAAQGGDPPSNGQKVKKLSRATVRRAVRELANHGADGWYGANGQG